MERQPYQTERQNLDNPTVIVRQFIEDPNTLNQLINPEGNFAVQKKAKKALSNLTTHESNVTASKLIFSLTKDNDAKTLKGTLFLLQHVDLTSETSTPVKRAYITAVKNQDEYSDITNLKALVEAGKIIAPHLPDDPTTKKEIKEAFHSVKDKIIQSLTDDMGEISDLLPSKKGFTAERQQQIKELWKQNLTSREIANQLGESPDVIETQIYRMRKSGENVAYRVPKPPSSKVEQRRNNVRELWEEGLTYLEIAEELDEQPKLISQDISRMRKAGEELAYRRPKPMLTDVQTRREAVKELNERGESPKQIAEKLGEKREVIRRDLYLMRKNQKAA